MVDAGLLDNPSGAQANESKASPSVPMVEVWKPGTSHHPAGLDKFLELTKIRAFDGLDK